MFLAASFSTLAVLALSITGSPVEVRNAPITIPITRRLSISNGTINLSQHDKARVAASRSYNTHDRRADRIPVSSFYFGYNIAVGIGIPPTTYNLMIDTGSSVTWVKRPPYLQTGTSVDTGQPVEVEYGYDDDDDDDDDDGTYFKGTIWSDTVTLGGGLTVTEFPLGIAETVEGFEEDQIGILGIGPKALSRGALIDEPDDTIPTIIDYLYNQDKIDHRVVGVFFQPITREPDSLSGELTFGEPDNTKYIGNVVCTPITTTTPASKHWAINQRITYGSTEILGTTAGIVDTGATFLYIASDAFERYKAATGGTYHEGTGLLSITLKQYMALQDLNFHIDGQIFSLTRNAQIWPRHLNREIDDSADPNGIYLIVKNIGRPSGYGHDFNLGDTFLQRFYTVFDGSKSCVGFAITSFTYATTNY